MQARVAARPTPAPRVWFHTIARGSWTVRETSLCWLRLQNHTITEISSSTASPIQRRIRTARADAVISRPISRARYRAAEPTRVPTA
jgi:hypothetical protein